MRLSPLVPAKAGTQSQAKEELDSRFRGNERSWESPGQDTLGDLRFRALMGEAEWTSLPATIRRRFSTRLAGGATVVYVGEIIETKMSRAGWLLAQAARLIGGPLPISRDAHTPSCVTVTEDVAAQGQHWTRLYARRAGCPQVVHSSKRFAGPTGLEEYVGYGVGMALTIHAEEQALIFRAAHYFLQIGRHRLRLPRFMSPGALTVTHAERGDGRFLFKLEITHSRLGRLIEQTAAFTEAHP
jgi:hypothetical protein